MHRTHYYGRYQNSQLGAAVFVDYTKLETKLSSVMFKDKETTRTYGVFALNRSHISLVWMAPPNVVHNQLTYAQYKAAPPACVATSFERNFSNLLV